MKIQGFLMVGEKSIGKRWGWAVGALIAVLVAVALSSAAPKIALFGSSNKPCNCTQGGNKYSGIVEDCCCDYETVDRLNEEVLNPSLQELVKTPFFRYFKVKLWCDCPFWPDDGMCRLRDCSVCECPDNEFPESFKKPNHGLPLDNLICQEGKPEAAVDRTLDRKAFRGWTEIDNPWTNDDETDNAEMTYVNLQLNPERYTGYTGPSAKRIWDAVYAENCPKYPSEELCYEERILYKLISGLHSSISVHIASDYLVDETSQTWGQNLSLMYDRVLRHPDRVRNLYFTYLFVLRAATKAADYLEHAEYDTGNVTEDLKTQSLIKQLLYNPQLQAACPIPFDEAKLWKGQSGPELKQKIQKQFRNISALMDCVGCEKCRLWGKLQVLGLGTALEILFSIDGQPNTHQNLQLQRNEVIALMNLLNRLSESVKFVHEMGPSAEIEAQVSTPAFPNCPLQRMWASLFNRPAPNCPLQRMWKLISDMPPPSCPLQRMWKLISDRPPPSCPLPRMWKLISDRPPPSCPLPRMWKWISDRPPPSCPLPRMWKWISDRPPPSCPLQRIWASING